MIPSPTSGCPNIALSEHIRISQLIAISHPPPSANPFTAAITGTGKVSIFLNTSFPFLPKASPSAGLNLLISPISAPATKDLSPSPVKMTALIVLVSILSKQASSSASTSEFKALSAFGLLIVTIPTAPSVSNLTKPIKHLLVNIACQKSSLTC